MTTSTVYRVLYHFEQGGKKASQDYCDYIGAAANDYETLKGVLNSNGRLQGGKLVIDACNPLPTGSATFLT